MAFRNLMNAKNSSYIFRKSSIAFCSLVIALCQCLRQKEKRILLLTKKKILSNIYRSIMHISLGVSVSSSPLFQNIYDTSTNNCICALDDALEDTASTYTQINDLKSERDLKIQADLYKPINETILHDLNQISVS